MYLKVTLFTEIPIGSQTFLHKKLALRIRKINCRIFQKSCLKTSKTKSILITYNYAILLLASSRLDNSLANLLRRLFTPQFEQVRPDLLPKAPFISSLKSYVVMKQMLCLTNMTSHCLFEGVIIFCEVHSTLHLMTHFE